MEASPAILTYHGPPVLERGALALGLAGAVVASGLLPGYPLEWRALLPLAVLGLGLWSPIAAYFAAVAVLVYPLWQLSPYLMVLFVAAALIPHRLILRHLPLALLIVWSPLLASLRLELAVPLLVGVFAGARRGAVAGALGVVCIKLYAAMSGAPLDLFLLQGAPGAPAGVAARFAGAGSIETLGLIFAPFAPNSSELLNNVLQIAAVAACGAVAGRLAGWGRARLVVHDLDDAPPVWRRLAGRLVWTALLPALVAGVVLALGLLVIPYAVGRPLSDLGLREAGAMLSARLLPAGALALLILAGVALAQPLPPGAPRARPARAPRKPARPARPAPPPVLPPPDLTPLKTGRFVPSWAAGAGPIAPDPPVAPEEAEDLVDLLMAVDAAPAVSAPATASHAPPGAPMVPRAREIAIEMD
jgi:hypothetical protein